MSHLFRTAGISLIGGVSAGAIWLSDVPVPIAVKALFSAVAVFGVLLYGLGDYEG